MHKCIVCGNLSSNTNINRSGVLYHGIPKNAYMRRKWLKVFGIDHCYDWQRVCSDHFLEKDYKPKKKRFLYSNTIPQPYERKSVRNGFPSNYVTQNNEILPKEQNMINDEHNKNAVEDNFVLPRRSPRQKNMMVYTLGSGLLCSVKNCRNRLSKNLSLFGYPKDLNLRIKWMEKCGLKKDPAKIVTSGVRVCSIHFEDDCFKSIELRNRLKPGSIPSLFLGDDKTDKRNVPQTSPPVNRWYFLPDKPPCSSSNSVANVESNQTPLLGCMDSTTRNAEDFEAYSIPGCVTNTDKEVGDISKDNNTAEQSSEVKANNVLDNTDNTSMTFDDSSSKSMSSINLEPIENSEVTEPSVNLSVSSKNESTSSELIETRTPVASKCISLTIQSEAHNSNSDYITRNSQCIVTDDFKTDKNRLIFEISKIIVLPSLFWKSKHIITQNVTGFYQQNYSDETVKEINFYNSLVPTIKLYGKKYDYNMPVKTKKDLDNLLDKIDSIEKCYGRDGFVFDKCIGYFEINSEDIYMCSGCQGLVTDQDLQRKKAIIEFKSKTIESLERKIVERTGRVLELRKAMAEKKKNRQLKLALKPSGILNIMKL